MKTTTLCIEGNTVTLSVLSEPSRGEPSTLAHEVLNDFAGHITHATLMDNGHMLYRLQEHLRKFDRFDT